AGGGRSIMNIHAATELKSVDPAIRDVIDRACLLLDEEKFLDWLGLCAPDFKYRITTYSPEIRRNMTWYEQDVAGLKGMVELLPKHNTDHGRLTRHATVYSVEAGPAQNEEDDDVVRVLSHHARRHQFTHRFRRDAAVPDREILRSLSDRRGRPALPGAQRIPRHAPSRQGIALPDLRPIRLRRSATQGVPIGLAEALLCARRRERPPDGRRDSGGEGPGHQGGRGLRGVSAAVPAHGRAAGNFRRLQRRHAHLHEAHLAVGSCDR